MSQAEFIIRWDDISPFQDRRKYRTLVDLFIKYDKPAVLGIIPDNRDESIRFGNLSPEDFVDELKQLEQAGWEIAQHGFRHVKHSENGGLLKLNNASEFAGRGFDDQSNDLKKGRELLAGFGFNPVTFIPPWHAYDDSTIKALVETGFKALSDGLFLYPRHTRGLLQLPMIFWTIPKRLKTLERLRSVYTICLHPQSISDDDLTALESFFRDFRPRIVTAASLLERADRLTRRNLKKMVLERIFSGMYKRQG